VDRSRSQISTAEWIIPFHSGGDHAFESGRYFSKRAVAHDGSAVYWTFQNTMV